MTDATIALKVDSSGLKTGQSEMDKLGQKGKQTEQQLNQSSQKMSKGFAGAAKAAVAMTAAYVGFRTVTSAVSSVIRANTEFEKSISNLSAITGAVGEDLKFYSDQAKEIGRTTSLSASQASQAFKLIASAKPDLLSSATSLAAVTREAVTLAEATGIELPAAAQALGAALNQFQLPASDANRVINALAASSQLGTAEVGAVTEAMRNAGAAANSLGLDFEETVAGIQALAASGRQGADAGTALRQVLLRLEATADQTLMPSVVGLDAALQELATRNLDNTELMDLFGQEAFTAAASLLAQKDIVGELNVTLRGTQIATEQARANMDNLSGDTLAARSATEALQIALGEKLNPALRNGVQAYTRTVGKIAEFVSGIGEASEASQILKSILDESSVTVDTWGDSVDDAVTYVNALIDGKLDLIAATVANNESITNNAELQERINMLLGEGSRLQARYQMLTDGSAAAEQIRASVMSAAATAADKNTESVDENAEAVKELTQEYSFLFRMQNRGRNTVETTTRSIAAQEQGVFDLINALSDVPLTHSAIIAKGRETTFVMQGVTAATDQGRKATEFWTAVSEEGAQRRKAAEKAAADASYRNWERTHEFVTNTILDIADNGGSAFERLGDIAVATAKRIAAEWLALKALNLFGISAPSGMGGDVGDSVANIGINQAASGVAGAVTSAISAGMAGNGGLAGAIVGNGTAGSGLVGLAASIPAWGWALAGVGAAAAALSKESTPSTNAGMLVGPMGSGADPSRTFAVPAFASGFQPVGSARRADQSQAMEVVNAFAAVDARLTEAIRAAGGHIDMSAATLSGFDEKGQGDGVFMGIASEKGTGVTSAPMETQLSKYAQDVMRHARGLTEEQKNAIMGGIDGSHANGLARVPFDGYRAELHRNEEVLKTSDPRNQNNGGMMEEFRMMRQELVRIGQQTKRTSDILLRVTRDGNALLTEAV